MWLSASRSVLDRYVLAASTVNGRTLALYTLAWTMDLQRYHTFPCICSIPLHPLQSQLTITGTNLEGSIDLSTSAISQHPTRARSIRSKVILELVILEIRQVVPFCKQLIFLPDRRCRRQLFRLFRP